MKFRTQINNCISKKSYSSTNKLQYHGSGQGAGNGGTKWTFISIPMIEVVEEVSKGCIIQLPKGSKIWEKYMLAFVDDKQHYVNGNISKHANLYSLPWKYPSVHGINYYTSSVEL